MALAGYAVTLKVGGTPTTMTAAAMEEDPDVDHGFRVVDASKRVLDPDTAIEVLDGGVPIDDDTYTVNYLFGRVVLDNLPSGAVTITAKYIPLLTVAEFNRASLNLSRAELDSSINGVGYSDFILGLKTAEVSLGHLRLLESTLDVAGNLPTWDSLHDNETPKLLEVGLGSRLWRGWVKFPNIQSEAPADGRLDSSVTANSVVRNASGRSERVSYSFGAQ